MTPDPIQPLYETQRQAMVASQLRTSAVDDVRVVAVMASVPRERFVPEAQASTAYRDRPLPLAGGRWQNAPLATGRLLTAADIGPADRVLLIGATAGYTAALVARLAGSVVAVESDATLAAAARENLAYLTNVDVREGTLAAGAPDQAPYDVLLIDGAVEHLPEALATQVKPGGRIVSGLLDRGVSRLAQGVRSEGGLGLVPFADIDCVVLPGFTKPRAFQFPE